MTIHSLVVTRVKNFFQRRREEHFIVSCASIVKKKIARIEKKFALETALLCISLWSLSGKNWSFQIKRNLCTVVDNYPVIVLVADPMKSTFNQQLARNVLRVTSTLARSPCSLDLDWIETRRVWI